MGFETPLKVFFDVALGGRAAGRLTFELFKNELPITCENFRCLCTGETGLGYYLRPRWYKSSVFHRCIPGFMVQGGDFLRGDGYGSESIYGQFFRDEGFFYRHSRRGILAMAKSSGRHTNSCQFYITFGATPWLDHKHVVFGQIIDGWNTLDDIEAQGTEGGFLRKRCEIYECGELSPDTVSNSLQQTELMACETRPESIEKMFKDDEYSLPKELYKLRKF